MSDTIQVIHWALEFSRPLRPGAMATQHPRDALRDIEQAKVVAESLRESRAEFGIFGDVCVTAYQLLSVPKEVASAQPKVAISQVGSAEGLLRQLLHHENSASVHFPSSGFVISEEFAKVGGLEGLVQMCQACPANATRPHPAGCAGTIHLPPDSEDVGLRLVIERLGLEREVAKVFQPTNPLWYGFWTHSPLSDQANELLGAIISALTARSDPSATPNNLNSRYDERIDSEMHTFVRATQIARRQNVSLHVSMAPPGHVDFGHYTVFAHCPNCKAEAELERWQRRYPTEMYTCLVCGRKYSPAATAFRESDEFKFQSLRELLGKRFPGFAEAYLIAQGCTREGAKKVIDGEEASEANRKTKAAALEIKNQKREEFIEKILYAGLHPTQLEDAEGHGESKFFSAVEFVELLQRCQKMGVIVVFMFHESADEELCMRTMKCREQPQLLFHEWCEKGCNEWFGAHLGVPDHVLEASSI